MGVYEEAKVRLVGLQKKVQRVYDAGEALKTDQSKIAKSKFKIMYASLESISTDFEAQLTIIIRQQCKGSPGSDAIDIDKERTKFEENYIGCKILADEHLPEISTEDSLNKTFFEPKTPCVSIPVEKLPVPHFKGDSKEYTSFRNQFDVLVHNNEVFKPVIKFSYLKAYLEGEPLKLINNLMLSDDNYRLALDILDKRYSNRRIIAQDHLDQLWSAKKAIMGDSNSIRQLLNTITESVGALKTQNYAVDQWDPILLYLFQKKLDSILRGQWELTVDTNDDPTVEDFLTFLTKFCKAAGAGQFTECGRERAPIKATKTTTLHTTQPNNKNYRNTYNNTNERKGTFSCQVCEARPGHLLIACPVFKQKTPEERHKLIKDLNRCYLCFSEHIATHCKCTRVCLECGGRHHTLLHFKTETADDATNTTNTLFSSVTERPIHSQVLMSTVEILIQDVNGYFQKVRALLDCASESSYLTENCRNRLGIARQRCNLTVSGISGVRIPAIKAKAQLVISPVRHSEPQLDINTYLVPRITGFTPSKRIQKAEWSHLNGVELADPNYNEPLPVDVLLGADVFPYIIRSGRREGSLSEPVGIETIFGWALMGNTGIINPKITTTLLTSLDSVDKTLRRFWEIEELPTVPKTSPAEQQCEDIYRTTTTRQSDGRYVVHLPFNCQLPELGKSRPMALQRFYRLESRLENSPELRQQYNAAMQDYIDCGHMSKINIEREPVYYTPHQAVIKPDRTTTKVRVVYDASAITSNGKSLNDNLFTGPKLQQDLPGIIVRFRLHEIVFTADIKQMFRQIVVTPKHRQYQQLLYRFRSSEPIQTYEMNTVTFGQRSSPFLAIRTLHQLAIDDAGELPEVQRVIRNDLYVDDVATGTNCVESALKLQQDLINVFKLGQFELRKWSSNSIKLLEAVPPEHRQNQTVAFIEHENEFTSVLGLRWEPSTDMLSYQYQVNPIRFSKRAILSEVARIYDPIGLLTPVTTHLKKLMKYLWSLGVGWDDQLPQEVTDEWSRYHEELPLIGQIQVRRQVTNSESTYELHGFCDSSESAYAAAVYMLTRKPDGTTYCQLLMGKSKVAPEKKLSIPRLELCGALLLAKVIHYVCTNLTSLKINRKIAWSDSTVALAWIKTPTSMLKTFVANRVAQIQYMTPTATWRHVPTAQNPVDCASRGLTPKELVNHNLWWYGPDFLREPEELWPTINAVPSIDDEQKEQFETKSITLVITEALNECPLLYQSDNWSKILRLTSYWLRVRNRLRKKAVPDVKVPPSTKEIDDSMWALVYWTQNVFFADEVKQLKNDGTCSARIRKLTPFLDQKNLLRVGGRLRQAELPFTEKYPVLLPKESRLTAVLIDHVHRTNCHPGPQTVQNLIQQNFWIISARSIIRKRIHRCIPCFRARPRAPQPLMGNLPRARLERVKPFNRTGIDFAGPFNVKAAQLRKLRITKAYLCIFVCMSTTAVHIELASDLSTATFIAALDRFLSRRGHSSALYSDCGTNFVGANRYLKEVYEIINSPSYIHHVTNKQITWHFNPPSAPHMGGLWEAAVKSAKSLLHRVIQDQVLTYEELNTVLTRIEASLNSRPLGSLSPDPNDFTPLTASHFMSFGPPATIPVPSDVTEDSAHFSLRQRWTLVTQIQQHFWQRWQREYLNTLQPRKKWQKPDVDLVHGDLVLIKEPSPPLTWKTARVIGIHPGKDAITRVVDVKLANGTILQRPVVKLCPLPLLD